MLEGLLLQVDYEETFFTEIETSLKVASQKGKPPHYDCPPLLDIFLMTNSTSNFSGFEISSLEGTLVFPAHKTTGASVYLERRIHLPATFWGEANALLVWNPLMQVRFPDPDTLSDDEKEEVREFRFALHRRNLAAGLSHPTNRRVCPECFCDFIPTRFDQIFHARDCAHQAAERRAQSIKSNAITIFETKADPTFPYCFSDRFGGKVRYVSLLK